MVGLRAAWLWTPVVAWAAFIFTLSSIPRLPSPPSAITDKHLHLGTYAVLAALLVRALARGTWTGVSMRVAIAAFVAATLYGVSDELHQRFVPGRDVSAGDLLADAAGAALAAGTLRAWAIIRRRS